MPLLNQIQEDVKSALRNQERLKLTTLRMLVAAIQQKEIDTRETITEDGILAIIEKQVQLRKEAAEQYQAADRLELFEKENEEANILKLYLPEKLDDQAMVTIIENTIASVGAKTIQDMGQVMSALKNQSQGRIDMKLASTIVRNLLVK
ncbi:MAG TPA: GatB/YqeY domain-containing protein [Gammaproteobacteria bacterium]|nr:GatB/YqeY domain-containing protein [Gammaproteobacteria bacterium]